MVVLSTHLSAGTTKFLILSNQTAEIQTRLFPNTSLGFVTWWPPLCLQCNKKWQCTHSQHNFVVRVLANDGSCHQADHRNI